MGLLSLLFGKRTRRNDSAETLLRANAILRARLDLARTTAENRRHWAGISDLTLDQQATPDARRTIIRRTRYEIVHNAWGTGMVQTFAGHIVGCGPRLQLLGKSTDEESRLTQEIELRFAEWCEAIDLTTKLEQMIRGVAVDGESFGLMVRNPLIDHRVTLDLRLYEPEQVSSPWSAHGAPSAVDGVELDEAGNPATYLFLRHHPGNGVGMWATDQSVTRIPAEFVCHIANRMRAGQVRGLPICYASITPLAELRRFTEATRLAAETAADIAAVLQSDNPSDGKDDEGDEPDSAFQTIELERNLATVLPKGYKLSQIDAKHPSVQFVQFLTAQLNECGRPMSMPLGVMMGNSSGYNYSSGRLDGQLWQTTIRRWRQRLAHVVLNRLFDRWYSIAAFIPGYLPEGAALLAGTKIRRDWFWDGLPHIDPSKETAAQSQLLTIGMSTLADEYAKIGRDWRRAMEQIALERRVCSELGIRHPIDSASAEQPVASDEVDEIDEQKAAIHA